MEEKHLKELKERIDEVLIPKVKESRKVDLNTNEEYYEKKLSAHWINKFSCLEEDYDYIFNYLAQNNIVVTGRSSALYTDYENYEYFPEYNIYNLEESMSEEELNELLKEYNEETDNDKKIEIRNRIVLSTLKHVKYYSIALSDYSGIDYHSLFSCGSEGLIKAVQNYELGKTSFLVYAKKCIKFSILREIPGLCNFYHHDLYYELKKVKKKIERTYGNDNMSYSELVDEFLELYLEQGDLSNTAKKKISSKFQFNAPEYFSNLATDERLEESSALYEQVEESLFQEQLKKDLDNALNELSDKERKVIEQLYGLSGDKKMSLREAGKENGVSYQTISNISNKALKKLYCDTKLRSYRNF